MKIVRYYPRAAVGDGGITGSVRRWSAAAARAGAEAVIAHDGGIPPAPEPGVRWVDIRHTGPPGWRVPTELNDVLHGANLLVLHSAWTLHNARAAAVARRAHIPYVLEPRGAYDPSIVQRRHAVKQIWWLLFEKRLVQRAAAIHLFFPSEAEHLRRLGWRGPLIIAPNGVTVPEGVTWDGGSGGYLLWIGRFDPEHKGLTLLLEALSLLPESERPLLRMYGPDWCGGKARTQQTIETLGVKRWVEVHPPIYGEAKWDVLHRAAGFVYPSRWEAFGNSTAEAVAAGVPTLVTPYPLGRFLGERGGAVLCEAVPSAIAHGLMRLGTAGAPAMARHGARLMREEMTWDRVAESWLRQTRALF